MPGPVPARVYSANVVHAIRGKIRHNTPNAAVGIQVGTIPAGSFVGACTAHIIAPFNAATTNVLELGTQTVPAAFATSTGLAAAVAGVKGGLYGPLSGDALTADTVVVMKYTQTGGVATSGEAQIMLEFYPHVT